MFDFRRLGLSLDDVGWGIPWRDAVAYVHELARETGSHLYANLAGLKSAASQADFALVALANAWLNSHRDTKKQPAPIVLPHPWRDAKQQQHEVVTPAEKARLTAELDKYSGFAQE